MNLTNLFNTLIILMFCLVCHGQVNETTQANSQTSTKSLNECKSDNETASNRYVDGKKEGLWIEHDQNGQLKAEGIYSSGLKKGIHKEWGTNGILTSEGFYVNGQENGLVTWHHEKGQIAGQGNMKDGIREGRWLICDIEENGFCIEAYFKNGKRDGIWKINHASDPTKLWKEQTFKNDKIISEKCWNEDGKVIDCK